MIDNFIPEIWSAKLFRDYDQAFVFGNLVNRDYEGEIRGEGDVVKINSIGPITVNTWTKNTTTMTVQPLTGAQMSLIIDKSDYFHFFVDDVDKAQQNPKVMGEAMRKSAVALANQADETIAGLYVDAGHTMTTALVGPTAIAEKLAEIHRTMDEHDVPFEGRWLAIPPYLQRALVLGAIGYTPATNAGVRNIDAGVVWQTGRIGSAMGFDIFMSNNLTAHANSGSTGQMHYSLAGNRDAITFADQITSVEAYRPELQFADAVKGLHVYGMKVVQPKALVACPFQESTV